MSFSILLKDGSAPGRKSDDIDTIVNALRSRIPYMHDLKSGDIITRINHQDMTSTNDIMNIIANGKPGDELTIEGIRQHQSFMITAKLGQRPLMSKQ